MQKLPKTTRQPISKKGPDKVAALRTKISPKRTIQLDQELDGSSSDDEEKSEDGEVDEHSMDFVQNLADQMHGTESDKDYTNDQLKMVVFDSFSRTSMPLHNILFIQRKLFEWRQDGLAKAAASQQQISQVVISNPVQMQPVHVLAYEPLKKLEQEFLIANAAAPVHMEVEAHQF